MEGTMIEVKGRETKDTRIKERVRSLHMNPLNHRHGGPEGGGRRYGRARPAPWSVQRVEDNRGKTFFKKTYIFCQTPGYHKENMVDHYQRTTGSDVTRRNIPIYHQDPRL